MQLLDDIIAGATTSTTPLADLLRQCMVLSYDLNHRKMTAWAEKELSGYKAAYELPPYRKVGAPAKDHFLGIAHELKSQPLPPSILDPDHPLVRPLPVFNLRLVAERLLELGHIADDGVAAAAMPA